ESDTSCRYNFFIAAAATHPLCKAIRDVVEGANADASRHLQPMSALPPKADIAESDWHVRFVPKADQVRCSKRDYYSITSSPRARKFGEISMFKAFAVFRLRTNVNLSACWTGRFTGLSPRRMRSTYSAPRR